MQHTRRSLAIIGLVCATALVGGACSSDDDASTATSDEPSTTTTAKDETTTTTAAVNMGAEVEISEFQFDPSPVTIEAGQTVTWTNMGASRHTVTADAEDGAEAAFKSEPVQPEQSFVQSFPTAGQFAYYCSIHPEKMQGTIIVE